MVLTWILIRQKFAVLAMEENPLEDFLLSRSEGWVALNLFRYKPRWKSRALFKENFSSSDYLKNLWKEFSKNFHFTLCWKLSKANFVTQNQQTQLEVCSTDAHLSFHSFSIFSRMTIFINVLDDVEWGSEMFINKQKTKNLLTA